MKYQQIVLAQYSEHIGSSNQKPHAMATYGDKRAGMPSKYEVWFGQKIKYDVWFGQKNKYEVWFVN